MKRLVVSWAAVAALAALATSSVVHAAPTTASPLALESVDLGDVEALHSEAPTDALVASASSEFAQPPDDLAYQHRRVIVRESIRHRPRRRRIYRDEEPARRSRRSDSFMQVHAGFLDIEGPERPGFLAGLRFGAVPDRHIQIGANVDWRHRENSESVVISEGEGPGGTVITTRRDLARSSSDLVPLLGFIQVSGGSELPITPYLGAGAGYEVMHLSAEDFETGEEFEGTFGGFGWQLWGGVSVPLSGQARLNAELFTNQAELSRDVEDDLTGEEFRETIDVDGSGMRFGISWGF